MYPLLIFLLLYKIQCTISEKVVFVKWNITTNDEANQNNFINEWRGEAESWVYEIILICQVMSCDISFHKNHFFRNFISKLIVYDGIFINIIVARFYLLPVSPDSKIVLFLYNLIFQLFQHFYCFYSQRIRRIRHICCLFYYVRRVGKIQILYLQPLFVLKKQNFEKWFWDMILRNDISCD